jgi:hypothetical protein
MPPMSKVDLFAAIRRDSRAGLFGAMCAGNHTVSGFSILRLARTAPEKVHALIHDVVALIGEGIELTPPTIIKWDELINAHVRQSKGIAPGKTVVAIS